MDLKISISQTIDYAIVTLSGKIDITHYDRFLKKLNDVLISGTPHILMDFTSVTSISSIGISAVVEAKKYTSHNGGKFIVIGLHQTVYQIFELTGVLNLVEVCDTLDEAISMIHLEPSLL